ncbi:MAG: aspartate/glutamate racemase family protein [Pararhodobacter sp.]
MPTNTQDPVIGLIVPPAAGEVPPEPPALYPQGLRFVARGLGLQKLSFDDYGQAVERVRDIAKALVEEDDAQAICLMGTSLSFFRGGLFNEELVAMLQDATGKPATTMSNAVCEALNALGARRVAVGTAYSDDVNARLAEFLTKRGFDVCAMEGMGLVEVRDVHDVTPDQVTELGRRAAKAAAGAVDAVLVSCGGLPALHLADALEDELGLPVVASSTAGAWGAVRLLGHSGAAPALGRLGRVAGSEQTVTA